MNVRAPAPRPCETCPYRRDVASGVWDRTEYAKLPEYDRPTEQQPLSAFLCHQQDGRLCAGWVGCHDMDESIGLRVLASMGHLARDAVEAARAYRSPVPLFGSGAEAAAHGLAEVERPGRAARRALDKIRQRHSRAMRRAIDERYRLQEDGDE